MLTVWLVKLTGMIVVVGVVNFALETTGMVDPAGLVRRLLRCSHKTGLSGPIAGSCVQYKLVHINRYILVDLRTKNPQLFLAIFKQI